MNLATSPQNECENRRRRPSRGLAHTPGTPIFALFRWTSERAASIRCPDGGSGQGSFASFLKGPLPPSGHRIERGTIDLQSDINCLPERSLLGAFGKQHDDYDHDVFNSAGSTLATPHFGPENGVHLRPTPLEALPRLESAARPARAPATSASWLPPSDGLAPVGERLTPTPSDSASHASPCTSRAATRSSARQLIVACEEIRIRPAEESSIQEGIFRPAPVVGSRTVTAPSPCGGDVSTSSSCP